MASSLADISAHYKTCRTREVNRRSFRCVKPNCKFQTLSQPKLIPHYVQKHQMKLAEARTMAKKKEREVVNTWMPTQAQFDALHLFD